MNLHLPTHLRRALLACVACSATAFAETYIAEGVNPDDPAASTRFYDGGKGRDWGDFARAAYQIYVANGKDLEMFGDLAADITKPYYSNSLDFSQLTNDRGHCWAYTSANMLEYWQGSYGVFARKAGEQATAANTPVYGYNYDKAYLAELGGTQSLRLNKLFYDSFDGQVGGSTQKGFAWYLIGDTGWGERADAPGCFSPYFGDYRSTNNYTNGLNVGSLAELSASMKAHFGYGTVAGQLTQTTKGQLMHLELSGSGNSHAITAYGFDTDADGNITALYVANSDDAKYGMEKVYGKFRPENGGRDHYFDLFYDEACTQTWNGWSVTGWSSLNTPQVLKDMLAEYERGPLVWMGTQATWTGTSAAATTEALPTDATGWKAYAGTGTAHAGYYNSYYDSARGVEFNDTAASGSVAVGGDIALPSMTVDNNSLAYSFSGEGQRISAGSFTKTGTGAVAFSGVAVEAGTVTLAGDVRFDDLHVTGTLQADGRKVLANSLTLDGDAVAGFIGEGAGEYASGTIALSITGGTTTVRNSNSWTALKSLALSEQARLNVGASVSVAENITQAAPTGQLAGGTVAGINAKYCVRVGTDGRADTGDVTLVGDISAGAYIKILGDANVTGNVRSTGRNRDHYVSIGGNASIGGDLASGTSISVGGNAGIGGSATASGRLDVGGELRLGKGGAVGGKVTAQGLRMAAGSSLTAGGGVSIAGAVAGEAPAQAGETRASITTSGAMDIGGPVSNIDLAARSIAVGAVDGSRLVMNDVGMCLQGGDLTLRNVELRGCSLVTATDTPLTLKADNVTLVLDGSNSRALNLREPSFAFVAEGGVGTAAGQGNAFHLHSDMLQGVNVSGTLTFDLSHWQDAIAAGQHDSLLLTFADNADFSQAEEVRLALGDGGHHVLSADAGRPYAFSLALERAGEPVPEPATVMLGLLGLAALSARRRRS